MTYSSKMNKKRSAYDKAWHWLKSLPVDTWVKFSDIPQDISYAVIDTLDSGYRANYRVSFNETFDMFVMTKKCQIDNLTVNLKRLWNKS